MLFLQFQVKYLLALAQVFNLVWCVTFPLLWFRRTRLLSQYLIAILVSTQGILFLTLRCAKDSELKRYLSNLIRVRFESSLFSSAILTSYSTKNNSESKSSELQHHQFSDAIETYLLLAATILRKYTINPGRQAYVWSKRIEFFKEGMYNSQEHALMDSDPHFFTSYQLPTFQEEK